MDGPTCPGTYIVVEIALETTIGEQTEPGEDLRDSNCPAVGLVVQGKRTCGRSTGQKIV